MPLTRLILAVALALAVPFAHAADSSDADIGWILEYSPPEAVHKIRRLNVSAPIDVKLGTPLHAGDVVSVVLNGRVLIGLADGSEREVSGSGAWSVPETRPRLGIWRVMQSMLGLVERQASLASSAVSKGGECLFSNTSTALGVPVLASPQKVVAGKQSLTFAWRGGCPPYAVTIESHGRRVAVATRLEARSFAFPEVSLKPGTHVFRIEESRGREFQSTFEVVTSAPVAPEDLNATSATLGTLAQTMWLAEQEEGAWRLESVKRLQPLIVERQLLAARMADAFLWSEERDPGMSSLQ